MPSDLRPNGSDSPLWPLESSPSESRAHRVQQNVKRAVGRGGGGLGSGMVCDMADGVLASGRGRLVRRWLIPLVIVAAVVVLVILLWPAPDRSETVSVQLGGSAGSADYSIGETGIVRSATGTYNGHGYKETSLDVPIRRLTDGDGNMTPLLTATFETADGGTVSCEMPRSHVWSTDSGSTETLQCSVFVDFDDLGGVSSVRVAD